MFPSWWDGAIRIRSQLNHLDTVPLRPKGDGEKDYLCEKGKYYDRKGVTIQKLVYGYKDGAKGNAKKVHLNHLFSF